MYLRFQIILINLALNKIAQIFFILFLRLILGSVEIGCTGSGLAQKVVVVITTAAGLATVSTFYLDRRKLLAKPSPEEIQSSKQRDEALLQATEFAKQQAKYAKDLLEATTNQTIVLEKTQKVAILQLEATKEQNELIKKKMELDELKVTNSTQASEDKIDNLCSTLKSIHEDMKLYNFSVLNNKINVLNDPSFTSDQLNDKTEPLLAPGFPQILVKLQKNIDDNGICLSVGVKYFLEED